MEMSKINYNRYIYTPDEMSEDAFLARFVVRNEVFEEIFNEIKKADFDVTNQHYIIVGQHGQGKTTLLRKLHLEVRNDEELSKFLLPIKFREEQYQIRSLCKLWEEVADYLQTIHEDNFENILDGMELHFKDDDYESRCFSYLESVLKSKKKKLLLLIDNIDELLGKLKEKEQKQLREILLTSSSFIIVGGSTKMFDQQYEYTKPFFEFFKIVKLKGLNYEESIELLKAIGKDEQKKKIEKVINESPERIETLRRLSGGTPRTIIMLFDTFTDEDGHAFEDLLKVLDDMTPLYKHRMDALPPPLQDIVHTIALNWDGMFTKDIAKKTRLQSKEVSAQLKQLERYQVIEAEFSGKNKIYKIKERFFNIWYLIRFGRKKDRYKVEWLVKFLLSWFSHTELEKRENKLIGYLYHADSQEAEEDYLRAIESADNDALNSLSWFYFEQTLKSEEALALAHKSYINEYDLYNTHTLATVLLWREEFSKSYDKFLEFLEYEDSLEMEIGIILYLNLLLSKGQFYKAQEFFEMEKYQLKDRYKPIWYALMKLLEKEFPDEIKKMGSELSESVNEVLFEIERLNIKYVI